MQETNRFIRKFTYLEENILTAYYMGIFMILLTINIRLYKNDICVKKCNWIQIVIIFLILQSSFSILEKESCFVVNQFI